MVALLTPDFAAIASMLVVSMPRSANSSAAVSSTFWWARWLRPFGMVFVPVSFRSGRLRLNFDLREAPRADTQQHDSNADQDDDVDQWAVVRVADQGSAHSIDTVGKRIER